MKYHKIAIWRAFLLKTKNFSHPTRAYPQGPQRFPRIQKTPTREPLRNVEIHTNRSISSARKKPIPFVDFWERLSGGLPVVCDSGEPSVRGAVWPPR
jgi:hypothetical protein